MDSRGEGRRPGYSARVHVVIPYAVAVAAALLGAAAGAYVIVLIPRAVGREPLLHPVPNPPRPVRGLPRTDIGVLAITAVVFAALALRLGLSPALPAYLFLGAVSVTLAAVDIRTQRLPDSITLPSYPVAIALLGIAALFVPQGLRHLLVALAGMAGLYAFYLVLWLISPKGLGFGDVKFAGVLGLYLGWLGVDALLAGAFLGFLLAGVYGAAAIVAGRATRKTQVPFGPFMIAGALLAILVGDQLAALYLAV